MLFPSLLGLMTESEMHDCAPVATFVVCAPAIRTYIFSYSECLFKSCIASAHDRLPMFY